MAKKFSELRAKMSPERQHAAQVRTQEMIALMSERFFLTTDNDSHWYIVPVAKQAEWSAWTEIDSDDERAWTPPPFAKPVGGSPTSVTFLDPQIV